DIPPIRRFGNEFFVFLVNLIFHAHYTDMCYGFRSFRKGVLNKLDLKDISFGIETEINIKAIKKHLKVIEVPSMEKKLPALFQVLGSCHPCGTSHPMTAV
ncbi:MAG: hypothetical protein ABSD68_01340, partial [Candidatus Micrarchaeales archaeon]